MAKLPPSGFSRPKPKEDPVIEKKLDDLFDQEDLGNKDGSAAPRKPQKKIKAIKNESMDLPEPAIESGNGKELRSAFPGASGQGSGFDINTILAEEIEPEGFVKRNFSIRRVHMNRIKELTIKANNAGHRTTQDDIINSIFDDFFRNKKV